MITKADIEKDRDDILRLWESNFPGIPRERYEWIYKNNPGGFTSCWVAKNDGNVIGSTALFPRRLFMNGQAVTAGIAGDFSVLKKFRLLGPALSLQKAVLSGYTNEGFDLIYGLPNEKSLDIVKRTGYSVVGEILNLTRPLKSLYYLKKKIHFPIIPGLVQKPVDLAIKLLARESFFKHQKESSCELLSMFDSRFDALWEKALPNFAIIGERTSSYLNWRFINSPHSSYSIFIVKRVANLDIQGYIVFNRVDNKVNIDDMLCIDDDTLDILLSEFILSMRREGIESISIRLSGRIDLVRKLQSYGFSIRGSEGKLVVLFPEGSPFSRYVTDIDNWYMMAGDNDI